MIIPHLYRNSLKPMMTSCLFASQPFETKDGVILVFSQQFETEDDLILVFEKFPDSGDALSVLGPWEDKSVRHDSDTLADVTLDAIDVTRDDAGIYRCDVTTNVSRMHSDVSARVFCKFGNICNNLIYNL